MQTLACFTYLPKLVYLDLTKKAEHCSDCKTYFNICVCVRNSAQSLTLCIFLQEIQFIELIASMHIFVELLNKNLFVAVLFYSWNIEHLNQIHVSTFCRKLIPLSAIVQWKDLFPYKVGLCNFLIYNFDICYSFINGSQLQ